MRRWLTLTVASLLLAGCASTTETFSTGTFTETGRLETELKRGVSTRMDVRRLLGAPKGTGSALSPMNPRPWEIWYYEDIEVQRPRNEAGVLRADVRQQILLVFFVDGVFDGFLWFSGSGTAAGQ